MIICSVCEDTGGRIGLGGWCKCAIGKEKKAEHEDGSKVRPEDTAEAQRLFDAGYEQRSRKYKSVGRGSGFADFLEVSGSVLLELRRLHKEAQDAKFAARLAELRACMAAFDLAFPVGSAVHYWRGDRSIVLTGRTEGPAKMPGMVPMVQIDGNPIAVERVTHATEVAAHGWQES